MSDFSIQLPEGKKGTVKCFNVQNVQWSDTYKHGRKSSKLISSSDPIYSFKCYLYRVVLPDGESTTEYSLYRFANDTWFRDSKDEIQLEGIELVLKETIIEREKELGIYKAF